MRYWLILMGCLLWACTGSGDTQDLRVVSVPTNQPSSAPGASESLIFDPVLLGLNAARAAVHVIATIQDPDQGVPLVERILQDVSSVTQGRCHVSASGIQQVEDRRMALKLVRDAPAPAAAERIAYPVERGRWAVLMVEVTCNQTVADENSPLPPFAP